MSSLPFRIYIVKSDAQMYIIFDTYVSFVHKTTSHLRERNA